MRFKCQTSFFCEAPRCIITKLYWNINQNIVEIFTRPIVKNKDWSLYSWWWRGLGDSKSELTSILESTLSLRVMLDNIGPNEPVAIGICKYMVYVDWYCNWSNRRSDVNLQFSLREAVNSFAANLL